MSSNNSAERGSEFPFNITTQEVLARENATVAVSPTIAALLAPALSAYDDGHYAEAVDHATLALSGMRTRALETGGSAAWNHLIAEIRSTPLFDIAQLDPFTSHSFKKPRGYPGDALLLDWIYRDFRLLARPQHGTEGARLYRETIDCGPAEAVRWRRPRLADLIDDAAATKPAARVLALAAGHLREADLSVALQRGHIGEVVALDQDEQSLAEINHRYASNGMPITTVHATIRDVIAGRYQIADFDLIYSAGLYDYLPAPVAEKLTTELWAGLNPGGQLLLTNFLHGSKDRGWMAALMDWFLIYRDEGEIDAFANSIPAQQIQRKHAYLCPTGSIGYLSLRKRCRNGAVDSNRELGCSGSA